MPTIDVSFPEIKLQFTVLQLDKLAFALAYTVLNTNYNIIYLIFETSSENKFISLTSNRNVSDTTILNSSTRIQGT